MISIDPQLEAEARGDIAAEHTNVVGVSIAPSGRRSPTQLAEHARRAATRSVEVRLIWAAFRDGLEEEDIRIRVLAAEKALEQACGRPAIAITGDADRPLSFRLISAFELDEAA